MSMVLEHEYGAPCYSWFSTVSMDAARIVLSEVLERENGRRLRPRVSMDTAAPR
jgi:hypothetical protein